MRRICCALRRVFAISTVPAWALFANSASAQVSLPTVTGAPAVAVETTEVAPASAVVQASYQEEEMDISPSPSGTMVTAASCGDCCAPPSCVKYHPCRACDRWYLGFSGGWQQRETVHEVGDPTTFIEFAGGFQANAQLGYRFDLARIEAEFSFFNNECNVAGSGGLSSITTGNVNVKTLMFNIYHDFDNLGWSWTPYVGAGIGLYQSELNSLYPDFFDDVPQMTGYPVNSTSDMPFAYQFRAGVSHPLGERTDFTIGYRYFHGDELTFSSVPFSFFAPTFSPDGAVFHSVEFGLRVKF